MNHKPLTFIAVVFFAIAFSLNSYAQNVVNGVYQGSPRSFMYLPQSMNPSGSGANDWVKPSYGSSYSNPSSTTGIYGWNSNNHSHAFIKRNANGTIPTDCNACYAIGSTYGYMYTLPLSWDTPDFTDGQFHYEDTVIQIGCDQSQGRKSQQMEYKFIPDTNNPVLLVNYMLVMENKTNGHGYVGTSCENPTITIEVLNANTDQLLNLGYYPSDYVQNGNQGTGGPNTNWPYARYKFMAPGNGQGNSSTLTPSAFSLTPTSCPRPQACNCQSDVDGGIVSYDFVTVAYRLTDQAANHTPVKLRIKVQACSCSAHWATIYYTAKMVPGKMVVDACGNNDIILNVPYGFRADSYEWYSGNDAATAIYDGSLNDQGSVYTKTLNRTTSNLKPYYRCTMESQTGVPFTYEAYLKIYDVQAISQCQQIVDECHYTFTFGDSSRVSTLTPNTVQGGYDSTRFTQWDRRWKIFDNEGNLLYSNNNDVTFTYRFPEGVTDSALVWLEVSDPNGACGPDTMQYKIYLDPAYVTAATGTDTIITCEENLPIIFDQATFGDQYTWHDAGTREVTYPASRWNGCDSTVRVTVIVQKPIAQVTQGEDFCDAFATTLTADANVNVVEYKWNNSETTQDITVSTPGNYTVTITDEGGCVATASINIPACKPFVNLPNAITPSDHNGLNDCVEVIQRNLIKSLEFSVFNRNGELVYTTTDKNFCWDGRDERTNKLYVNATYNWILKITDYDGYKQMFKGSITVL